MPRRQLAISVVVALLSVLASACQSSSIAIEPALSAAERATPVAVTSIATPSSPAIPRTTPVTFVQPTSGDTVDPAPLISVGLPTAASADVETPSAVVDGDLCSWPAWRTSKFPSWLAIKVGAGPKTLLLTWVSSGSVYTTAGYNGPSYGIPSSYQIQTSADSTDGSNGTWQTVVDVSDNSVRSREHLIPFAGQQWVRMQVRAVVKGTVDNLLAIQEIQLRAVTADTSDSFIFLGDSITDAAYRACDDLQPSFATLVHQHQNAFTPIVIDAGVGGVNSSYGVSTIDQTLAANPDVHYWAIGYGTNDAWQTVDPDTFARNLQTIIDAIRTAGHEPILARIPYALKGPKEADIQALNDVIDRLTSCDQLIVGPDLFHWFKQHPEELGPDGVHPATAGSISINRLWYETLEPLYEGQAPPHGAPTADCAPASGTAAGTPVPARTFELGVNYPWLHYGADFGTNAWGETDLQNPENSAQLEKDFAALQNAGVGTVRWFVFGDGRAGIVFDSAGQPTGLDQNALADFDIALATAHRHHLTIDFVLLDFLFMRDAQTANGVQLGGHADVINSAAGQQALIQNVFAPLFRRYGSDSDVLSWEVMNEPEFTIADFGNVDAQISQPTSLANFQAFTRQVVGQIHALTHSQATIGAVSAKTLASWTNLGLDYYQVHYYDWMHGHAGVDLYATTANRLHLDRPVVVGEFPAANSATADLSHYLDHWYENGFAGAWAWSLRAQDEAGAPDLTALAAWSRAHADVLAGSGG